MIRLRSLRENESIIAPCSWVSEASGCEYGIFLVITKTNDGTDAYYCIAGTVKYFCRYTYHLLNVIFDFDCMESNF